MWRGARFDGASDAVGDGLDRPEGADNSSSSPVWALCTGTAHPKIASCESIASGMHECTSRSPVRC